MKNTATVKMKVDKVPTLDYLLVMIIRYFLLFIAVLPRRGFHFHYADAPLNFSDPSANRDYKSNQCHRENDPIIGTLDKLLVSIRRLYC